MKYIILDLNGIEASIIFDELLQHIDVAKGVMAKGKVVAAGFCNAGQTEVWGKSVSLGIGNRGIDDVCVFESSMAHRI
jgi:hypothetical protein